MYGSSIDSIDFYLTNDNNEPIDLQVSQFSITMMIGWHVVAGHVTANSMMASPLENWTASVSLFNWAHGSRRCTNVNRMVCCAVALH
jgi:hypothetical protein